MGIDDKRGKTTSQTGESERAADTNAREKAEQVMKKDQPDEAPERTADDRNDVYRPDENIDDQKHSTTQPGHNTTLDKAPMPGRKTHDESSQKDEINEAARDENTPRHNG
ncbi:hypothetical protein [Halomonas sp. WWR20]